MKGSRKWIGILVAAVVAWALALLFVAVMYGSPKIAEVERFLGDVPSAKGWDLYKEESYGPQGNHGGNLLESVVERYKKPDFRFYRKFYIFDAEGIPVVVYVYHDGQTTERVDIISYTGSSTPPMDLLLDELREKFPGLSCRIVARLNRD